MHFENLNWMVVWSSACLLPRGHIFIILHVTLPLGEGSIVGEIGVMGRIPGRLLGVSFGRFSWVHFHFLSMLAWVLNGILKKHVYVCTKNKHFYTVCSRRVTRNGRFNYCTHDAYWYAPHTNTYIIYYK
jgi:hypothetical protein